MNPGAGARAAAGLRTRWRGLVICGLLGMATGLAWGVSDEPVYSATATVVPGPAADGVDLARGAELGAGLEVARQAAALIGDDVPAADLLSRVELEADPEGSSIAVTAESEIVGFAPAVADGYALALVEHASEEARQSSERAAERLSEELEMAAPDSSEATALAERLAAVEERRTRDPLVLGAAALESGPEQDRSGLLWASIGLLVGLVLGSAAILLRIRSRRPIAAPDALARLLGAPLLAAVDDTTPPLTAVGDGSARIDPTGIEPFRMLVDELALGEPDGPQTLSVVPACGGDGASEVALGLAVAAGELGLRVLLVEANLRSPGLATRLGIETGPGLGDYLAARATPREVLRGVRIDAGPDDAFPIVCVPAGGRGRKEAIPAFDRRFEQLVERLPRAYDLVVFEAPAPFGAPEAGIIAGAVSGTIVVVRAERTGEQALERALELLRPLPLLGGVLVGLSRRGPGSEVVPALAGSR